MAPIGKFSKVPPEVLQMLFMKLDRVEEIVRLQTVNKIMFGLIEDLFWYDVDRMVIRGLYLKVAPRRQKVFRIGRLSPEALLCVLQWSDRLQSIHFLDAVQQTPSALCKAIFSTFMDVGPDGWFFQLVSMKDQWLSTLLADDLLGVKFLELWCQTAEIGQISVGESLKGGLSFNQNLADLVMENGFCPSVLPQFPSAINAHGKALKLLNVHGNVDGNFSPAFDAYCEARAAQQRYNVVYPGQFLHAMAFERIHCDRLPVTAVFEWISSSFLKLKLVNAHLSETRELTIVYDERVVSTPFDLCCFNQNLIRLEPADDEFNSFQAAIISQLFPCLTKLTCEESAGSFSLTEENRHIGLADYKLKQFANITFHQFLDCCVDLVPILANQFPEKNLTFDFRYQFSFFMPRMLLAKLRADLRQKTDQLQLNLSEEAIGGTEKQFSMNRKQFIIVYKVQLISY